MSIAYHVYTNDGAGGPINYTTPITTVTGLSWVGPAIQPGSGRWYGVRAFDAASGQEEANTSAVVRINTAADGTDLALVPAQPSILGATVLGLGSVYLSWLRPVRSPVISYLVFAGAGSVDPTGTPVATVAGTANGIVLTNLAATTTTLGLVAVVGSARSPVATVSVTLPATPPPPDNLTAVLTDQS